MTVFFTAARKFAPQRRTGTLRLAYLAVAQLLGGL